MLAHYISRPDWYKGMQMQKSYKRVSKIYNHFYNEGFKISDRTF